MGCCDAKSASLARQVSRACLWLLSALGAPGCNEDANDAGLANGVGATNLEADADPNTPTDATADTQPATTAKPCHATLCADTNPCTHDYPRPDCTCAQDPLPLACNDNNACTTADLCGLNATCAGLPLPATACLDTNPCTLDACDPKLGCIHPPADPTTPCRAARDI